VIEIHKSKGTILLDDEDAAFATNLEIKQRGNYLSVRKELSRRPRKRIILARLLLNLTGPLQVDHINRNALDNRRCNLRVATKSQNARNNSGQSTRTSSKFKGVTFTDNQGMGRTCNKTRPWRAYTRVNGKRIWIGCYATELEAAQAYNEYVKREFGEFACCNTL